MRRYCALLAALAAGSGSLSTAQPCTLQWASPPTLQGINSPVNALRIADLGSGAHLFLGGRFSTIGDLSVGRIARWDGTSWNALGGGVSGIVSAVHAIAAFPSERHGRSLVVGGEFSRAGDVPANHVALWDGHTWTPLGEGTDGPVFALAVFDDGAGPLIFAAGSFSEAGGAPARNIAAWNGESWFEPGGGIDNRVLALAVFSGGGDPELIAGGDFQNAGGGGAARVARWNGSSWRSMGSGLNGSVLALTPWQDLTQSVLAAGGTFTASGSTPVSRIARWDGQSWSAIGSGVNGTVRALTAVHDGVAQRQTLFVGGAFSQASGVAAPRLARWIGSWAGVSGGANNSVFSITGADQFSSVGPAVYAGGSFTMVGGAPAPFAAELVTCVPVPGDYDDNGLIEPFDWRRFVLCLTGPGVPYSFDCARGDADFDRDIDLDDFGLIANLLSDHFGPGF